MTLNWHKIVSNNYKIPRALELLTKHKIELVFLNHKTQFFNCQVTGDGPYKDLGCITKLDNSGKTKIHALTGTTPDDLHVLASVALRVNEDGFTASNFEQRTNTQGQKYHIFYIARPVSDCEDLTLEAFEEVNLTKSTTIPSEVA